MSTRPAPGSAAAASDAAADRLRACAHDAALAMGGLPRARALRFTQTGFDRAAWRRLARDGWIGLRLPTAAGGAGNAMAEAAAAAEAFGAALLPEPLIASALSAALLHAAGGGDRLASLLAGDSLVITAWQEEVDGLDAPGTPNRMRLFAPAAFGADRLLIPMRIPEGMALLEADARDVEFQTVRTQDGGCCCHVRGAPAFTGALLARNIAPALQVALEEAALATAAALLGVADAAFAISPKALTASTAAAVKIQLELARAAIATGAAAIDQDQGPDAVARAVSGAKARAGAAALLATREAVRAVAADDAADSSVVALLARKAMTLAGQFGSASWHRGRFASLWIREPALA